MPDLLEEDIRATAPQPSDEFVARLEARVEAGFPKTPKPAPRRAARRPWWSRFLAPALACGAVIVVVGIGISSSTGGGDESGSSGGAGSVQETAEPASRSGADDAGSAAAPESSAAEPAPATGGADRGIAPNAPRKVERRTALELSTPEDDFAETTAGVLRVADRSGTIVQTSDVSQQDGAGYATYDLRVPASRLDEVLAQLSELGSVKSRSATTDDITAAYVSAQDRLEDARDERAALLKSLERADSENERSAIRARLRDVRLRISAAQAEVNRVKARTDRARVDVTVRSTGESGAWTPGDAWDDALRILEVVAGIALVVAAIAIPLFVLVAVAVWGARLTRRRRRDAVLG